MNEQIEMPFISHGMSGEDGIRTAVCEENQTSTVLEQKRALTEQLMERVGLRAIDWRARALEIGVI